MSTTRALQIECLLDPVIDHNTGSIASGYTVYFYSAGTSSAKNVWTEKEKTNPFTSKALGSDGTIQLYGDGIYKIVVKNTDGDTIHEWDNVKIQANNFSVVTKTGTYTATPDDDVILVDTSAGNITINLETIANFIHPVILKNIGGNNVVIDPDGSEQIDGSTTVTIYVQNQVMTLYPDTSASTWRKLGAEGNILADDDLDTKIQVEESADEDIIRFDCAGTEQIIIQDGSIVPTLDSDIVLGSATKKFKYLYADEYDIEGTYRALMPSNGVGAHAVFMLGISTTVIWMFLNAAPPGWKVTATGADTVLGVSGGAGAYNVNGGNPDSSATFVISGLTKDAHAHGLNSHTHILASAGDSTTGNVDLFVGNESGQTVLKSWTLGGGTTFTKRDNITGGPSAANTEAQSDSGVTSDGTWRPSASVGKLFILDNA